MVLAQPGSDERLTPLTAHPEAEQRAGREADRRVEQSPPRSEERAADGPRDLARDRRDDHLERLDGDEDERGHPAPRRHGFFQKVLVPVEPYPEADGRSVRDD